jgi:hypothetical protein
MIAGYATDRFDGVSRNESPSLGAPHAGSGPGGRGYHDLFFRDRLSFELLDNAIREAGLWGPRLFMMLYAIATVFFVPGSLLTLAGGALFGPLAGTFYNLTGPPLVPPSPSWSRATWLPNGWRARPVAG